MNNSKVVIILALVLGFVLGGILGGLLGRHLFPKIKTETVVVYDSSKEKAKIDSLETVIKAREERIVALLDSASKIKTVVVVKEINKVKDLPMTDNVELLRENLIKHGELTNETDSLPKTLAIEDTPDTLAVLSEANVKDVNIIAAKYEGEVEVNERLTEALSEGENLVHQKDSIIGLQSSIIVNQEINYSDRIQGLEKSLKIEKTQKTVFISILGTAAAVLGVIALTSGGK
jgi:hypothetical protein